MPTRPEPIAGGYIYHIYNRGVEKRTIFHTSKEYTHFLSAYHYYNNPEVKLRFSYISRLPTSVNLMVQQKQKAPRKRYVDTIAFALMPNHFHFLVIPHSDDALSQLMKKLLNSYTKYINTKYKRVGPLFQGQFHSKRVKDDNILLHVSRYIHLNPVTHSLVSMKNLHSYPWTSYQYYNGVNDPNPIQSEVILSHFKSPKGYENFVTDQADYQKELAEIRAFASDED